jgi:hypothetical protein
MGTKRTAEFRQEAVRIALTSGLTAKAGCIRFWHWVFDLEPVGSAGSEGFARTVCPI